MLLRLKSEHQTIIRENEQLKYENEQLRKNMMGSNMVKSSSFAKKKANKLEDIGMTSPAL